MYCITETDLALLRQRTKTIYIKIDLLNEKERKIGSLEGIASTGASYSIDADSDTRRTCSLDICLKNMDEFTEKQYFTYFVDIYIGMYSNRTRDVIYYKNGRYVFDSKSDSYSSTEDNLSISLIDKMGLLDADHRGALYGSSGARINAIDPQTWERLGKTNTIRNAMISCLSQVDEYNYVIKDIGSTEVYTGNLSEDDFYNANGYYFNEIPYNLEYSTGSSVLDEINDLRDLYDNYETYYDVDGVFRCNMIPTTNEDEVFLNAKYFDPLVISQGKESNIYDVKNVVEVWGKELDVDGFSYSLPDKFRHEGIASSIDGDVDCDLYTVPLMDYESLSDDGEYVYDENFILGVKFSSDDLPDTNSYDKIRLQVESWATGLDDEAASLTQTYPAGYVVDALTGDFIGKNFFDKDVTYLFKWKTSLISKENIPNTDNGGWYFLGQYQVHAMAFLTDGTTNVSAMAKKYNLLERNVYADVESSNPYVIEKIGEVRTSLGDEEYSNLSADSIALSSAKYNLWKTARRQDTISLETVIIPFLDVNKKVEYTNKKTNKTDTYIVKKISGDLDSGTMNLELMKFYPESNE